MKFITIDLGFNLSFVYAHDGESQTAPSPSAPSFGCDVWGRELGGDEGVQVSVCLHVSSSVEMHGVLQWATMKPMWSIELPFSKMKRGEKKRKQTCNFAQAP